MLGCAVNYRFIIINFVILIALGFAIGRDTDSRGKKSDFCEEREYITKLEHEVVSDTAVANCFCKLVKDRPTIWFYEGDINVLKNNISIPCINSISIQKKCADFELVPARNRATLVWGDSYLFVLLYYGQDYQESILYFGTEDSKQTCDLEPSPYFEFE
jgi:hypothetical protein